MLGKHAGHVSVGVNRVAKSRDEDHLTEYDFYEALHEKYLLSDANLELNSYPLWEDASKTKVKIMSSERDASKELYVDDADLQRICTRCGKQYRITKEGTFVNIGDCIYHW